MKNEFMGYPRSNGTVGVRNKLLVIAPTDCSYQEAIRIAGHFPDAVAITQYYGCRRDAMLENQLVGIAGNPNVAAILIVGLGCETIHAEVLVPAIEQEGKPVKSLNIQEVGGTLKAIDQGKILLNAMTKDVSRVARKSFDISNLTMAVECGGSDATSGLAANPAVGVTVDKMLDAGGTVIFSEPLEMVGAQDMLAKRAASEEVASKIHGLIQRAEKWAKASGVPSRSMSKGNIDGGLSTIEEKSLGAILKGGTREIVGVLENSRRAFEKPEKPGLYLQDGTQFDVPSITHMVAAGAQVVIFTTGRGSTTGHAIAPVLKITGNPQTYANMNDTMDINAGRIIENQSSIFEIGSEIFDSVLRIASGEKTKAEELGYYDFSLWRTDPVADNLLFGR